MRSSVLVVCALLLYPTVIFTQSATTDVVPHLRNGDTLSGVTVVTAEAAGVSANGVIATVGFLDAPHTSDRYLHLSNGSVRREGDPIPALPGLTFGGFSVAHHRPINASGQIVYFASIRDHSSTIPIFVSSGLFLDDALLFRLDDPAPGIPGEFFESISGAAVTDDGRVFFVAWFGGLAPDSVAYYFDGQPMAMNVSGSSIFRTGTPIDSGPLTGATMTSLWNADFNASGTLLTAAAMNIGGMPDSALIRKRIGFDYEVLLVTSTATFLDPLSGNLASIEFLTEVQLNANDQWAGYGRIDSTIDIDEEGAILTDVPGGGITVVARKGLDVSAVTGTGEGLKRTIDLIREFTLADNGDIYFTCNLTGVQWGREWLFRWRNGELSVVATTDLDMAPGVFESFNFDRIFVTGSDQVIFNAEVENGPDGAYLALPPTVLPVEDVICSPSTTQSGVDISWTPAAGQSYSGFRITVDGVVQTPDLPPGQFSYTASSSNVGSYTTVTVQGVSAGVLSPPISCQSGVWPVIDYHACSDLQNTPVPITGFSDTITVDDPGARVRDLLVSVDVDAVDTADILSVQISSPFGITVELWQPIATGDLGLSATFTDLADDPGGLIGRRLHSGLFLDPAGPGQMSDFDCALAHGDWTLEVFANHGSGVTAVEWCIDIAYEFAITPNCCARPLNFAATTTGCQVELTWTNMFSYESLAVVRELPWATDVFPIAATDQSFSDAPTFGAGPVVYRLEYVCTPGGPTNSNVQELGVSLPDPIPVPSDFECSYNHCDGTVEVTWNNNGFEYEYMVFRNGIPIPPVFFSGESLVDSSPPTGTVNYSFYPMCNGNMWPIAGSCGVEVGPIVPDPSFVCGRTDDSVQLWWGDHGYTTTELRRDGVLLSPQPLAGETFYFDPSVPHGQTVIYTLTVGCAGLTAEFECTAEAPEFRRGDCNLDGSFNLADAIFGLVILYPMNCTPGVDCPYPPCEDACDTNDDGSLNIADAVRTLNQLFPTGCSPCPDLAPPGTQNCGFDATQDTNGCFEPVCP